MVFIKDSEPEVKTRNRVGKLIHVLGIPRIDLRLVDWRCKKAAEKDGDKSVLHWGLPYEIIVVGYYGEIKDDEQEGDSDRDNTRAAGRPFVPREVQPNQARHDLFR